MQNKYRYVTSHEGDYITIQRVEFETNRIVSEEKFTIVEDNNYYQQTPIETKNYLKNKEEKTMKESYSHAGEISKVTTKNSPKAGDYICVEVIDVDSNKKYYKNYYINHPRVDVAEFAKQGLGWLKNHLELDQLIGRPVFFDIDNTNEYKSITAIRMMV